MATKEQYQEVAQKKFEELGATVILFAYFAHITDLQAQLIKDLASAVDQTKLSAEVTERLTLLDQLLAVSSIDFSNITAPTEVYKIPGAIDLKNKSNILMTEYITALARDGLL